MGVGAGFRGWTSVVVALGAIGAVTVITQSANAPLVIADPLPPVPFDANGYDDGFAIAQSREQGPVITGKATGTQHPSAPDQWRPGFHYSPPSGWLNDPKGLIYVDGTYHMYYQAVPNNVNGGPKNWGHATSTDLVRWTEQPLAIAFDGVRFLRQAIASLG